MISHEQLAEAFEALCDLSPAEQRAGLAKLEPELATAVMGLLRADQSTSSVFDEAGGATWLAADLVNQRDPDALGPFRIRGRLGEGAMGVVHLAEQDHPRRLVALKVLHPWMRSTVAGRLFRFEAQALGQVQHPGIPAVYQAGEADGIAYLAMERVEGSPLLEWAGLAEASTSRRLVVVQRIAQAVQAAHDAGLIHRDLKPSNVLVTEGDAPKLLDFGVATGDVETGRIVGTPAYMSPEQANGGTVDERSDQHALATLTYELLTGRLPVQGSTVAEVLAAKQQVPVEAHRVRPSLPTDVGLVLQRALSVDPQDRYPSVAAFAQDLARAERSEPLAWRPQTARYLATRWARRNRGNLRTTALAAALLVLVAGTAQVSLMLADARQDNAARRRLAVAEASMDASQTSADWEAVERTFSAFVNDPAHRGTSALASAWRAYALRLVDAERPGVLDALTVAYTVAATQSDVDAVRALLADRFDTTSNWNAGWMLHQSLTPGASRERLEPARIRAAVALRRFDEVSESSPDHAFFQRLRRARRLDDPMAEAGWIERPGRAPVFVRRWSGGLTVEVDDQALTVDASAGPGAVAITGNTLWIASGVGRSPGQLTRVDLGERPLVARPWMALPAGRVARLRALDTPSGPRLLLATTYPTRGLWRLDVDARTWTPAHEATHARNSDAMAITLADLDDDGQDEVLAAFGAWSAHDLRVFRVQGDDLVLAGRRRLGTVSDVIVLPGPTVFAAKVDAESNPSVFPDGAGFGPEAGVYVMDGELEPLGHLPPPLYDAPASGPERSMEHPITGDFDGDGRPDLAWSLRLFDVDAQTHLWVVLDALGERRGHVVSGVHALDAHDVDGDGIDELLVSLEDGTAWLLGVGDDRLPPLTPTQDVERPPPPAGLDPHVAVGWTRANELLDLGLADQAAGAMAALAAFDDTHDHLAAIHERAGALYSSTGQHDEAAQHFAVAVAHGAGPSARRGQIQADLDRLALESARRATRSGGGPAWLTTEHPLDARPLLTVDTVDDWHLERPYAFRRRDGMLQLDVFNDEGVVARLPVRVDGPAVGLDIAVELHDLELGAGLAVALMRDGEQHLLVGVWGQGGGGHTKAFQNCGGRGKESIAASALHLPSVIRLRAARIGPEGSLRCNNDVDGAGRWVSYPETPIEPGDYTLELRATGAPAFSPPTQARAVLRHLRGVGIRPRAQPRSLRASSYAALFDGRLVADLPDLEHALATEDRASLDIALRRHLDDVPTLRHLLRRHGELVTPLLAELLGPRFATVYHQTWRVPARHRRHSPEVQAALLRPALDTLDPATVAGARLRLSRAEVHMDRGQRANARTLALSIVDQPDLPAGLRVPGLLLLARLASEPTEQKRHLDRARALLPVADMLDDRLAHHPELQRPRPSK